MERIQMSAGGHVCPWIFMIRIGVNFSSFYFTPYIQRIYPVLSIHLWQKYIILYSPFYVRSWLQDFIAFFLDECNSFLTAFPASSLFSCPICELHPFSLFPTCSHSKLAFFYSSVHTTYGSSLSTIYSWAFSILLIKVHNATDTPWFRYPLTHTLHYTTLLTYFNFMFFWDFLATSSFD